jgi:hypothetical protein
MTFKRSMLVLFFAASLACTVAGETIYFLVGPLPESTDLDDSLVIPLAKPEDIEHARDLIVRGPVVNGELNRSIPVVGIRGGKEGINRNYLDPRLPEWSWHVEEVFGFGDFVAEAIMWDPTSLETQFDWSQSSLFSTQSFTVGFVYHTVVRELGPAPLYLSILPEGDNLQFYWTGLGTNYVYTLEGRDSLASTNWSAIPDASWPQKTNHWTLAKADASARLYRVRAEVLQP